ncbi:TetR family transcriptional regulator [Saccharopolyspora erythraea]|uniref:TetR/AcrR family transcriptional regulator n=1 Tax=Saccharopolyspora erythraea TaxID=1836 RepID=UPI001BAD4019|nr:TetR/AcrR family transcriptional regulator [Saccharopolyspora erythraea]QUH03897.1 TetR family transcriptional regulator [Saccharopolyspora erythraea]
MTGRRAVPAEKRSRHPTEVRRRQVVRAALELISEQGIAGVSARDIARHAGVSPGTITYHFSGVREIVAEAIALEIDEYYIPLMAQLRTLAPREALSRLVDALFTPETERHWRMWFEYWLAGLHDDDFVDRQAGRYAAWQGQIRDIIVAGQDAGLFTSGDAAEVAVRFVALTDGLALQWLRGVPPLTGEQARDHLRRFAADELGA